jgi:hypothetical protein
MDDLKVSDELWARINRCCQSSNADTAGQGDGGWMTGPA